MNRSSWFAGAHSGTRPWTRRRGTTPRGRWASCARVLRALRHAERQRRDRRRVLDQVIRRRGRHLQAQADARAERRRHHEEVRLACDDRDELLTVSGSAYDLRQRSRYALEYGKRRTRGGCDRRPQELGRRRVVAEPHIRANGAARRHRVGRIFGSRPGLPAGRRTATTGSASRSRSDHWPAASPPGTHGQRAGKARDDLEVVRVACGDGGASTGNTRARDRRQGTGRSLVHTDRERAHTARRR